MGSPVQPGTWIAEKYRVTEVIGEGGMGVVVAAEQAHLGRTVAIKFLNRAASPDVRERFAREGRIAVTLQSEHVCNVYDVGQLPTGEPYMVMERLEGRDLARLVAEQGALSVSDAVDYILQACEALAEAHALGVVHRDLKPSNLFMTRRIDGSPCIKILDFGISKMNLPEGDASQALTMAGAVLGSPRFIAPEQIARTSEADARSDIWSLGAVLHELLSGHAAFAAETVGELCFVILNDDPAPLTQLRADATPQLSAVVARCLNKDPAGRFQNVAELALALRRFGSGAADLSADRAASVFKARGWSPPPDLIAASTPAVPAKSSKAAIALVLIAMLIAVLGIGGAVWFFALRDDTPSKSARKSKGTSKKKKTSSQEEDDPLEHKLYGAKKLLKSGKAEDAYDKAEAILDTLSEAGVRAGDPRSRFAARVQRFKADALSTLVVAPTVPEGRAHPPGSCERNREEGPPRQIRLLRHLHVETDGHSYVLGGSRGRGL